MNSDAPFTIFVVEDNEWYNKLLVHNLSLNPDFIVKSFFNGTDLLNQLHEQPNIVTVDYRLPDFNGEELLDKLWSQEFVGGKETIKTHIKTLRKKLSAAGVQEPVIETVYGFGYRLRHNA